MDLDFSSDSDLELAVLEEVERTQRDVRRKEREVMTQIAKIMRNCTIM